MLGRCLLGEGQGRSTERPWSSEGTSWTVVAPEEMLERTPGKETSTLFKVNWISRDWECAIYRLWGQPSFSHDYGATHPTEKFSIGNSSVEERGNSRGKYLGESSGKGVGKCLQTYVSSIKVPNTIVPPDSADMVGHFVQLRIRPVIEEPALDSWFWKRLESVGLNIRHLWSFLYRQYYNLIAMTVQPTDT